jgi:hypothetical protein
MHLNPDNAFEIYYDLKSADTGGVAKNNFDIKIFQYSFSHNRLRILPIKLLLRLMTLSNAGFGFKMDKYIKI